MKQEDKKTSKKPGAFARLRTGLSETRQRIADSIARVTRRGTVDEEALETLEADLLSADLGVEIVERLIVDLRKRVRREAGKQTCDIEAVTTILRSAMLDVLRPCEQPLSCEEHRPFVVLVVGVNGAGKTTTIGKIATRWQKQGRRVMLAAGDTFRAAAVEQLRIWGERSGAEVIAQQTGADGAAVIYDAYEAARARGVDRLLADTAGRLHNKQQLMNELVKVKRVLGRLDGNAPHEVLLVLDAVSGRNALEQAREFHKALGVTGLVITRLDGTAKGGVLLAIAWELGVPVRYIGTGEGVDDLHAFSAEEFVDSIIGGV